MRVDIAWWDLDGSQQTIESLQEHLRDGAVEPWSEVHGLRLKLWIADRDHNRWGAIMLWESDRPADRGLPPNQTAEIIGYPLTHRAQFDVEATVEGVHSLPALHGLAPTLTPCGPSAAPFRGTPMHEYTVVDAFARTPLEGNPVAIFFDSADLTAELMQRIAKEMNLSEVTFVLPAERGGDARIRIFTPVNELPFAGHPMLGTAVALGKTLKQDRLLLETAMGVIPFELGDDNGAVTVRMQQPIPTWEPYEHRAELLAALGVESSTLPVEAYRNGPRHVFVGLESVATLSTLHPDHRALSEFPDMAVNCFAGNGTHWRTRMFSPAYGVVEDAATGSAAGPLAIHLARHGLAEYGQDLKILQGVEMGRPSHMLATAHGKGDHVRSVYVGGHGAVVARGTIYI